MLSAQQIIGMQELRQADPERYLATLYAPEDKREALAVLYLFNVEIAAIRDRIHEPLPGEIRVQWWRDVLAGNGEVAEGHPLAERLIAVMKAHSLPKEAFDRYLEARIFDLYDDPIPSRNDLEGYCGDTASTIIQLAALILDPNEASRFAAAAGHGGCALAISGLIRLLPVHTRRGQCYIPQDILQAAGTSRDEFVRAQAPEAAMRAIEAMIALGREHAGKFAADAKGMPPLLGPAFLPAALAPAYFDAASGRGFDPMQRVAEISALRRHWLLFRTASSGWR